jgi:NTP pyrophosphatase (non-canonical NTP hydrolase)
METPILPITSMAEIQERSLAWRRKHFPETDVVHAVAKLAEEVGELARAVIAETEHRTGRGDVVQEAAQVVLIVASIVAWTHPDRDLMEAMRSEIARLEDWTPPWTLNGERR